MANVKWSAFPSGTTIAGTDITVGLQSAANVQWTWSQALTYVAGGTATLTNKTYDTAGTGNTFKINGTTISAVTGTGAAVLATSPTLVTPALGTPSSGTLTNATGLPISTGVSGLGTGVATALAVNTGSAGAVVLLNGALGTPSSGTATNLTGLPLTTGVTGVLPVANGGTNASSAGIAAFNNITGYSAAGATGTTSTNLVFSTSPTLVTPVLGAATGTSLSVTGALTAYSGTAIPAGGTTGSGLKFSSTSNYGIFFGSGAPTLSAAQGSIYLRSDGTSSTGIYTNTDGATTWAAAGGGGSPGGSSGQVQYNSSGSFAGANLWQGTNILEQYNSTTAQTWRLFNTRTDASNGEWLSVDWATSANVASILTVKNGTGTQRALSLGASGVANWQINTSGHFVAATDNTYDIGASGANRPRNIYAGGNLIGAYSFGTSSNSTIQIGQFGVYFNNTGGSNAAAIQRDNATDGLLYVTNAAGTGFNRFCFGGTSSSFPALKRSSATLQARLADDSDYAQMAAAYFNSAKAYTVATLPAGTVGFIARVSDASAPAVGSTVSGGGAAAALVWFNGSNYTVIGV